MALSIDILICTIDDGIHNVHKVLMPKRDDVHYVVSWQRTADDAVKIPVELLRDDVKVATIRGRGLSRNRNNAIARSSGDICLIADDDITFYPEKIDEVRAAFERTNADLATFQYDSKSDQKNYPDHEFSLDAMPKGYYVTSFEIAFRRESIAKAGIQFNELFGLGAPVLQAGEEAVFVLDCLKAGLNCRYFPIAINRHDHATTHITRGMKDGVIMANGAYLWLVHPFTFTLRAPLMAWRTHKQFGIGIMKALSIIAKGAAYIIKEGTKGM